MNRAATIIQTVMWAAGVLQIVLGILFWTGNALGFVNGHILLGLLIVLLLWAQAALGIRAGVPLGLSGLAIVWGLIVPVVGMAQAQILPGAPHWIVQIVHLVLGLGALGLGDTLARRIKAARDARLVPAAL